MSCYELEQQRNWIIKNVTLTHRCYLSQEKDINEIEQVSNRISHHLETSIHNLMVKDSLGFQRQVSCMDMPESITDEFKK